MSKCDKWCRGRRGVITVPYEHDDAISEKSFLSDFLSYLQFSPQALGPKERTCMSTTCQLWSLWAGAGAGWWPHHHTQLLGATPHNPWVLNNQHREPECSQNISNLKHLLLPQWFVSERVEEKLPFWELGGCFIAQYLTQRNLDVQCSLFSCSVGKMVFLVNIRFGQQV